MTTNKSGSVNQLPLYVCTGCMGSYEDCTWLAGDLHVHDGECWCDPCWYMRRFEFPDLPEWEDLEPYTPALQAQCEKLVEALEDIAGTHHHSASAGEYFAKVARAALAEHLKQGGEV